MFDEFPQFPDLKNFDLYYKDFPKLIDIGYDQNLCTTYFKGGELEALRLMKEFLNDKKRTAIFEKPKTNPTSIKPDTTSLSPYLK